MTAPASPGGPVGRVRQGSDSAARRAAGRILDIHHPERTAPVPLLTILQDADYHVARKRDPISITAFYLRDAERRHTIGLNTRAHPHSQRFALAHAMAHGELHDADLLICHEVRTPQLDAREKGRRSHASAAMERQAHIFAAELLLPAPAVRDAVGAALGVITYPTRGDGLARRIAADFEVAVALAAFRLVDLAILSP